MHRSTSRRRLLAGLGALALLGVACDRPGPDRRAAPPAPNSPVSATETLTLGDVDPDTPARRSRRLQPLADYLARGLADHGIRRGQVRIARDVEQMAGLLRDGSVDLYLDSVYPTLTARRLAGTRVLLRRWVLDVAEYASLIVTTTDGEVRSLEDLQGRVIALQEDYSTSGYLLPAALLIGRGFELRNISGTRAPVAPTEIGYVFSHDEENTLEMLVSGSAAGGAISDQEYAILPENLRAQLSILARSPTVPRQLLSARPGLDPALTDRIEILLLALRDDKDDAIAIGDSPDAWVWKFDRLPEAAAAELERVAEMIARVDGSGAL